MKILLSVNGRKFPVDWVKEDGLNKFIYKRFIVKGKDCNQCARFVVGYISLHQEFIKPNGPIELRKTLEFIVGKVYNHIFPHYGECKQNGKQEGLVYSH